MESVLDDAKSDTFERVSLLKFSENAQKVLGLMLIMVPCENKKNFLLHFSMI